MSSSSTFFFFFFRLSNSVYFQCAEILADFTLPLLCHDILPDSCTEDWEQLCPKHLQEVQPWVRTGMHTLLHSWWARRAWGQPVALLSLQWLYVSVPYGYVYVLCWGRVIAAFKSVERRSSFVAQQWSWVERDFGEIALCLLVLKIISFKNSPA